MLNCQFPVSGLQFPVLLMKSENGIIAFLQSSATEWRHCFNLQIALTRGAIELAGILSGTKSYGQETLKIVYKGENDGGMPREQKISYIEDNSWRDEIFEFADTILNNTPVLTGTSFDAHKTMELVYKIYTQDKEWAAKFNITL